MSAFAQTGKYHPKGYNDSNHFFVEVTLEAALAGSDTLDVTLPEGVDDDCLPVSVIIWGALSGTTRTLDTDAVLTSHDSSTRKTRLTASGAVAIGSVIILHYIHRLSAAVESIT